MKSNPLGKTDDVSVKDVLLEGSGREDIVVRALQECQAAIDTGTPIDRAAMLEKYSEIRDELSACIDGLELMRHSAFGSDGQVAAEMHQSTTAPLGILGDFRIVREIGRGGMGVVYEAEQISLHRLVALKVLPFAAVFSKTHLQRFKNEALAAASLDHPGIVAIHSVGCERGVHYYAMQLVEGQTLAEVIHQLRQRAGVDAPEEAKPLGERSPLPSGRDSSPMTQPHHRSDASSHSNAASSPHQADSPAAARPSTTTQVELQAGITTEQSNRSPSFFRTVANLGIQAAEALDHAHQHGIVHRDVKPANSLLDLEGRLLIADFGLARIGTDASMTMSGDLLGTLRYMSPEQALGKRAIVDHRADVYSLGATLYELLTLEPAFKGHDRQQLLSAIATDEPLAPRRINPAIPADLETVVLKAIQKEPQARYATAQDLADDLKRFLDGKPIEAKRPTAVQRLVKWSRRHRAVVTTAIITLLVTLSISTGIIARAYQAERSQRHIAEQEKARAVENFGVALEAVDELYAKFHEWLAADTYLSLLQQRFLNKALGIYKQLLARQGEDNGRDEQSKHFASTTYSKIARIHLRMHQYAAARTALAKAVALSEQLTTQVPDKRQYRVELADGYNTLSMALQHLSLRQEALKALDKARHHTVELASQFPDDIEYQRQLAVNDQYRAATLFSMGRLDEAEQLARGAKQRWAKLAKEDSSWDTTLNVIRNDALLAGVRMNQGRLDNALDVAGKALRRCLTLQLDFRDYRDLARVIADITDLLGQIHYTAGRPEEAVTRFQEALEQQRRLLNVRMKPVQYVLAEFFKRQSRHDEYEEPELVCGYIETQLRLAAALRQLGKPYEAELVLGEAVLMSTFLVESHQDVLRYLAALANSCAELSALLQERRPDEAAQALEMAAGIWREAVAYCAGAPDFCSRVHGQQNDLEWFTAKYPKQSISAEAPNVKSDFPGNSVFFYHTMGVMLYEAELWKEAIIRFAQSAKRRQDGQAFDWYYLAMAHRKMDEQEEARRWFEKAEQWTEEHMKDDKELGNLRSQAAKLFGAVGKRDSARSFQAP